MYLALLLFKLLKKLNRSFYFSQTLKLYNLDVIIAVVPP